MNGVAFASEKGFRRLAVSVLIGLLLILGFFFDFGGRFVRGFLYALGSLLGRLRGSFPSLLGGVLYVAPSIFDILSRRLGKHGRSGA
jgi:hypothetical protein